MKKSGFVSIKTLVSVGVVATIVFSCRVSDSSSRAPSQSKQITTRPDAPQALTGNCQIKGMKRLFSPIGYGFTVSPVDENLIAYDKYDTTNKVMQLYVRRLDTGEERCLSCQKRPGGPPVDVHKGVPSFHPDGKHIILQVEMVEHPFKGKLGNPGPGWFNNVWMTTVDGERWWQLTDYPSGNDDRFGVLFPKVSHSGKRVAWTQLYKGPKPQVSYLYSKGKIEKNSNPWGYWQLNLADLVIDAKGARLENVTSLRPGGGNFYETQDWSPDDNELLFSADIGRDNPHKIDIWKMALPSQKLTQLTKTDGAWEEFASYSPDGKKIVIMSSEGRDWDPSRPKSELVTESYLMDADGTNKTQLTHFNEEGFPESYPGRNIAHIAHWSKDGKRIILAHHNLGKRFSALWMLTFEGACGAEK